MACGYDNARAMMITLSLLLLATPTAPRYQPLRNLPDAAFSGVIEIKMKPGQMTLSRTGLTLGGHTAIDLDQLVGSQRGLMLPQNLRLSRTLNDLAQVEAQRRLAESRCNCVVPDMSRYVRLRLPSKRMSDARVILDRLNALPQVEVAYPITVSRRPVTPNFEPKQFHLDAPPTGVDARFSLSVAGARGKGIKVGDVEGAWTLDHEDLPACADLSETPGSTEYADHGTAVLGEIFGVPNSFGVTGIAPEATCQVASDYIYHEETDEWEWNVASAMQRHANVMSAGDVILLEVHQPGPNTKTEADYNNQVGYIPAEATPAVWDLTRSLSNQGIIVVAAAGNGNENLDDPIYNNWFSRTAHNSGAIMVGAGAGSKSEVPRSRMYFSNYGSRVDVQAWGEQVTTLGYGDAQNGPVQKQYTFQFAGTSSASPIVTASVAVVQSYLKSLGKPVMKSAELIALFRQTGTAQAGDAQKAIGPLPNLRSALTSITVCGDGKKAPAEACDDGNTTDGDGCSADCTSDESCGNEIIDAVAGETCDDGNEVAGDGCRADCRGAEVCGDGEIDEVNDEVCDDGNKVNGDGCTSDCKGKEVCGDERIDEDELCDDGNKLGGDGCSADCKSDEVCGNGVVDVGEECDDGNSVRDDACSNSCKLKKTSSAPAAAAVTAETTGAKSGCSQSGSAGLWLALAALLLLRRRAQKVC